jgi:F-type H+-transporting ATPase subunit epsilon
MKLKVISSSKQLYENDAVDALIVPTTDGEIEILPQHINLVSTLNLGKLVIKSGKAATEIILNGGMIRVNNDDILVLADEANLTSELVQEEIAAAIAAAEQKIATSELEPSELIQLEKRLRYERFKQGVTK